MRLLLSVLFACLLCLLGCVPPEETKNGKVISETLPFSYFVVETPTQILLGEEFYVEPSKIRVDLQRCGYIKTNEAISVTREEGELKVLVRRDDKKRLVADLSTLLKDYKWKPDPRSGKQFDEEQVYFTGFIYDPLPEDPDQPKKDK